MKFLSKLALPIVISACLLAFPACAGDDGQGGGKTPHVNVTENTDFSALVSEVVNETGWRAAFADDGFGTYTIKLVEHSAETETRYIYTQKTSGETKRCARMDGDDDMYCYLGTDGENVFVYEKDENAAWKKLTVSLGKLSEEQRDNALWELKYTLVCPDFSEYFDRFTYDESTGAYSYYDETKLEGLETNSIFENWNANYYLAKVKIVNGKPAYLQVQIDDSYHTIYDIYLYDFDSDSTIITYPDV